MSRLTCEEARELVPELALGTIAGDERARVITHVTSCASCRRLVEDLSEVADSILLLAPEHEPDAGFESTVLARMKSPGRKRAGLLSAAAAVLIAAAAAGAVWLATADERDVASHYQEALAEANGEYFGVRAVKDAAGNKLGNVFLYTGHTDWVFVVFEEPVPPGTYVVDANMEDSSTIELHRFELTGVEQTWGRALDIDLGEVSALRFQAPDDEVLVARFD